MNDNTSKIGTIKVQDTVSINGDRTWIGETKVFNLEAFLKCLNAIFSQNFALVMMIGTVNHNYNMKKKKKRKKKAFTVLYICPSDILFYSNTRSTSYRDRHINLHFILHI